MVKKLHLLLTFILFNVSFLFGENVSQDTLNCDLQNCIEIALSENSIVKIAEKEVQKVKYNKKVAISTLLPNVNLGLSYGRTLKKQKMYFDIPGMPYGKDGIEVGRDNNFNSGSNGLSARLPLFAPALWAMLNMSDLDMELALEKAHSSKISLVNEVTKAYFSVLMAQDSYRVLEKTFLNSKENHRITQEKYKQGLVSELQKINTWVQLKNVEANMKSAENGIKIAKLQLKMLLGVDMQLPLTVKGTLSDYENVMFTEVFQRQTKDSIQNIAENSTEIKQLDIQTKQLKKSLQIQNYSYLPTLSASVNYNISSMVNDEFLFKENHKWFPTSNFALILQIPIFQGGQRYFKHKQTKIQLEQLEEQKKSVQRAINLQIANCINTIEKTLTLMVSNKEAMRQAEKAMTISHKTYEVGVGTYLDVANAELAYMQSGLAYNQAVFEYLSAKADLMKIIGKETLKK